MTNITVIATQPNVDVGNHCRSPNASDGRAEKYYNTTPLVYYQRYRMQLHNMSNQISLCAATFLARHSFIALLLR
jgi:hypothetical protein